MNNVEEEIVRKIYFRIFKCEEKIKSHKASKNLYHSLMDQKISASDKTAVKILNDEVSFLNEIIKDITQL